MKMNSGAEVVPSGVAILADDLTGALDAAAPFALPAEPVDVIWGSGKPPATGGFAFDSETRELPARRAEATVESLLPHLAARGLALKKVDSLLRGNTITEVAACWKSGAFGSMVIAPAFPAQDRVTRGGCQYARVGGEWRAVAPGIVESLKDCGLASRRTDRSALVAGNGILVCDAEDEGDLAAIAASGDRLEPPVLWCGSSGLAHALSPVGPRQVLPPGARRLFVVGSRHPASLAQADSLARLRPDIVVPVASMADVETCADAVSRKMQALGAAALWFRLPPLRPEEAGAIFRAVFVRLAARGEPPDTLVVTGGDTLIRLCNALEATRLRATGEWRPGLPTAVMADGIWHDTNLISKSGGFGQPDALAELAEWSGRLAS